MDLRRIVSADLFRRRLWMFAGMLAVLVLALGLAACGDDDDDDGDDSTTAATTAAATGGASATDDGNGGEIDYGSLRGEINIDGSSTVFPITDAMAEEFAAVAPDVLVNVAFSGTGGGFELFCAGDIEIADASRPIKEQEEKADMCGANGIDDIVEVQVAVDALTVMVNPANDFVTCLTVEQLFDIFTGAATNWNQVDPSFPDESISLYYPGTDSGTFDYFVESIITKQDENATHTGTGTSSEDDNILATGIEGDEQAIGYFGFAYYQEAGSQLKAVEIDNGDGCIAPSVETALDGSYAPLSRPLFIYTRESFLTDPDSPVLGFVKFYLDNTPEIVPSVGYVNLPDDVFTDQEAKITPFLP